MVAPGVSLGFGGQNRRSPAGRKNVLPPLPGLDEIRDLHPGLTPGATVYRASGATAIRANRFATRSRPSTSSR